MNRWLYSLLVAATVAVSFVTYNDIADAISLIVKPYTFTNNTKADANKVNSDFDTVYAGTNAAIGAINSAAGTKATLAGRLGVSLNEDGTFKNISGVTAGSEWTNPGLLQTYSSASIFYVDGSDETAIYLQYRRVKAILGASTVYSEVSSSTYTGGKTIVTLADAVLTDPIETVEHSTVSPITSTSSMSTNMLKGGGFTYNPWETGIRVMRGTVSSAGAVVEGATFGAGRSSTGVYAISYSGGFSDAPSCVVTLNGATNAFIRINNLTSTGFSVLVADTGGSAFDSGFTFMCAGPY